MGTSLDVQGRAKTARRIFGLIPVVVFLVTFVLFVQHANSQAATPPSYVFLQLLLRSVAASLASALLCIGAYSFYRYLLVRSPGL